MWKSPNNAALACHNTSVVAAFSGKIIEFKLYF